MIIRFQDRKEPRPNVCTDETVTTLGLVAAGWDELWPEINSRLVENRYPSKSRQLTN